MPQPFPNLPPEHRGHLHWVRHDAACLRDNPWGDPSERDIIVYTPPGYGESTRDYPAVMLLAGFAGTGEQLLNRNLGDLSIATRIDRLIAGGCPPFMAVLPDCMTRVGGSQFVDSPGIGQYCTYIADSVRETVSDQFRVSDRWGVAGRSSGGFGAVHLACERPGAFHAVASHAGDMGFDLCWLGDLGPAIRGIKAAGGLDRFHQTFWSQHRVSSDLFAAFNVIAMACAFSPDPTRRPIPARLPFDVETGAIDFEVLHEWRAFDPIIRADDPGTQAALKQLDLLFLDAGDADEYHLHLGARRFTARLAHHGVPFVHEEFSGTHRGTAWRYDVSLPQLATALSS